MGYDRDDGFPFDFEPHGIPFGSKSKEKLSPRSYPIQCERKWKHSFLSVSQQSAMNLIVVAFFRPVKRVIHNHEAIISLAVLKLNEKKSAENKKIISV